MQNHFFALLKMAGSYYILDGKRDHFSTNLLVKVWIKLLKYRLKVKEKIKPGKDTVKVFVRYITVRSTGWLNSSEMEP